MSEERCNCGAGVRYQTPLGLHFDCYTYAGDDWRGKDIVIETERCLRRQLARAKERAEDERERANAATIRLQNLARYGRAVEPYLPECIGGQNPGGNDPTKAFRYYLQHAEWLLGGDDAALSSTPDNPYADVVEALPLEVVWSNRGFWFGYFQDSYGDRCRISQSSSAEGEYIWLGVEKNAMHLDREKAGALAAYLAAFASGGHDALANLPDREGDGPCDS